MSKTFTAAEVGGHNKPDDLYLIVDGDVFDLTKFQDEHPGGKKSSSSYSQSKSGFSVRGLY